MARNDQRLKRNKSKNDSVTVPAKPVSTFAAGNMRLLVPVIWAVFAVVFALISITSLVQKSPTVDEPVHLLSGYANLKWADYRANPEHPPLAKMWAALPLVFMDVGSSRGCRMLRRCLSRGKRPTRTS
jgi:peptidoglycan/LPS O-acetylase OafA/YrhL